MNARILIVDDNERLFDSLAINLRKNGLDAAWAGDGGAALRLLEEEAFAATLLDLALGAENGIDVLPELLRARPGMPVIIITGFGTFEAAVRAIKLGASDFLAKPLDIDRLLAILWDAIKSSPASNSLAAPPGEPKMAAASSTMRALREKARLVANSDLPVLITGESGTGKELMAKYVHFHSPRRDRAFLSVNCSAITESLADSELFGHAKGSFTGAASDRAGFFEKADGGTLHLDEIGDMSPAIQAKILRVLEDARVRRVGGDEDIGIDVRLIVSTNKELERCIEEGSFRRDLFYRLNAANLHLPPLRERREDIPSLLDIFLGQITDNGRGKRFSAKAEEILSAHDWPGNIRELRNMVRICALVAPGMVIEPRDIPRQIGQRPGTGTSVRLADNERELIRKALVDAGGNRQLAAQLLGISRRTLYNKLERHDLA